MAESMRRRCDFTMGPTRDVSRRTVTSRTYRGWPWQRSRSALLSAGRHRSIDRRAKVHQTLRALDPRRILAESTHPKENILKRPLLLALALGVGCSTQSANELSEGGRESGARSEDGASDASADAGRSRDASGMADSVTPSSDGASLTDVSATACFPDGAAADAAAPIGAPCVPEDGNPQFYGFSATDVDVETKTSACASGVCLANHFQGFLTCPYGQNASGEGPDGMPGCKVPGTCAPVTVEVQPQLSCRTAAETVYCSCRCADPEGKTDGGGTYCTCPGSMMCVQLVSSIGDADVDIAGGYCIKTGTKYTLEVDAAACPTCDPTKTPCP
jgi:hypothetical protein